MVDFAKLREERVANAANREAAAKKLADEKPKVPKPRAAGRDKEDDRWALANLLGKYRTKLNEWETGFCESCLNWLLKHENNQLSVKQADVLDKTWAKHNEEDEADPTPPQNPPAKFAAHRPGGFDADMDDDIPF